MPLSLVFNLETTSCKAILERIKARAIDRWGEKWIAKLVHSYVAIVQSQGDEKATAVNRRPHVERIFQTGSCNADTLIALASAVGCRFQLICTTITEEIEDL